MDIFRTMTFEEYRNSEHTVPYVLEFGSKAGRALLYYGADHLFDPSAAMFDDIEGRFEAFHPACALVEGGVVRDASAREETIRQDRERGWLCLLCHRRGVPVGNLEPAFEREISQMLRSFTKEQLYLFYCVRQTIQYRHTQSRPPYDEYIAAFGAWIAGLVALDHSAGPLEFLRARFREAFGRELDWEALDDQAISPLEERGWLNKVSRHYSYLRDQAHVSNLVQAVSGHTRVFAVAGASHSSCRSGRCARRSKDYDASTRLGFTV